jgi:hypothetical protein
VGRWERRAARRCVVVRRPARGTARVQGAGGVWWCGSAGSGYGRAEVFVEPGEPAVEAVPLIGGDTDAVELAGIDD